MKIHYLFYLLFLWVSRAALAQTSTENYVLSRTYKNKGMVEVYTNSGTPPTYTFTGIPSTVQTNITYLDGLGKTKLEVAAFASPTQKDILVKTEYDGLHRPEKNFLPIAAGDGNGNFRTGIDYAYYNNGSNVCTPTANACLKTLYEASPLSRVNQQVAPGISEGAGVRTSYKTNTENVYWYLMNSSDDGIAGSPGYYPVNTLNVIESKDENDKWVKEYRDRYGRVVMKRVEKATNDYLDTYYVYDQKGQLRFVLQPQYQDDTSDDKLAKFAFQYSYDNQGRMTKKRVPGTDGNTIMSYNDRDLLEQSTDAKGQNFHYTYDELNRPKKTLLGNNDLSENYYDGYSFISESDPAYLNFNNELGLGAADFVSNPKTDSRKGLATGSIVRILNSDGTLNGTWLRSVTYYDNKYRVIQTVRELYGLGSGAYERVSFKYDFSGKVVVERIKQSTSSNEYILEKKYAYDHADRLTYVTHKVMEGSTVKKEYNHFTLTYNEIGQLTQKSLHGNLQALTYNYTPRGWVCSIGNSGGNTFNVGLTYNSNGNINYLSWGTPNGSGSYSSISYDGANRMTDATGSPYEEKVTEYDRNGNIRRLKRFKDNTQIDDLYYNEGGANYNGNRLMGVRDDIAGTAGQGGFNNTNSNTITNDYAYDANGNLTQDQNKNISAIAYNLLNLTRQLTINSNTVSYTYDASGNKHEMQAPGGVTTLYAGAFEYNSAGTLQRIGLEEGQLIRNGGNYTVNYYLKDHLGNVRTVLGIDETTTPITTTVLQETDYYPFGLPVVRSGSANNKYLYNGKEKQPETEWLDYGARMYMSDIGRWGGLDPHAEKYESISSYSYGFNNPIRFLDIKGRDPGDVIVLFSGANLNPRDPFGITTQLKSKLLGNLNGGKVERFVSNYAAFYLTDNPELPVALEQDFDNLTQEAYEYIKTNVQKGGRIGVYGYSWGGVLAMYLSRRLNQEGIKISFLGVVDAADGPWSEDVNRIIPENVAEFKNIYQENPSGIFSRGYKAKKSSNETEGTNYKVRYVRDKNGKLTKASHSNVDDSTLDAFVNDFIERFNSQIDSSKNEKNKN